MPAGARAYFTKAGLAALRELLQDRRSMNPERFAHLRQELGLDPIGVTFGAAPVLLGVLKIRRKSPAEMAIGRAFRPATGGTFHQILSTNNHQPVTREA